MKKNETRAKKIEKIFNTKFPLLTILNIWESPEGTVIKAVKDPTQIKMGIPFYQLLNDEIVINANPLSRNKWFKEVVQEDNMIYRNTDYEVTTEKLKED